MTIDDLSRLAYSGTPPESALPHEWLLWYRLRDIYEQVRIGSMTKQNGQKAKQDAVSSYESDKAIHEQYIMLWKRIEYAATQYAKAEQHTPEADEFYKAVYGVGPGGRNQTEQEEIHT